MASENCVKVASSENFEWNVEIEIKLFEAMIGLKPTGINKHFEMACICEKFETSIGKSISPDILWQHLGTMYDLPALDKKETVPFLNIQEEFSLPEAEYSDLMKEKLACKPDGGVEQKENSKEVKSTQKNSKDSTPAKAEVTIKKEKIDTEEVTSNSEPEKKETNESEFDSKKGKQGKEIKTRGKRSLKDKKIEEDVPTTPVSSGKKEETNSSNTSSNKKEKHPVGKRTLRSRVDDSLPNKSLTPPPAKRARRI